MEKHLEEDYGKYSCWKVSQYEMKHTTLSSLLNWFDGNDSLKKFLIENYSIEKRTANLSFFTRKKLKKLEIVDARYSLAKKIYSIRLKLEILPKNIVIYGAGFLGKVFYDKIKNFCKIICFVDLQPRMKDYDGIPVLLYDDFIESEFNNECVIVTPAYIFGEIAENLARDGVKNVVSIEEFLH